MDYLILLLNLLLWGLLFAFLFFAYYRLRNEQNVLFFHRRAREEKLKVTYVALRETIHNVLKEIGGNYEFEEQEDRLVFFLSYQVGSFIITIPRPQADYVQILYPVFLTTEIEHLAVARTACNEINRHSKFVTAFYDSHIEKDTVRLSLTCTLTATEDIDLLVEGFELIAKECFLFRRHTEERLRYLIKQKERLDADDLEFNSFRNDSLDYVILESERDYDYRLYGLNSTEENTDETMTVGRLIGGQPFRSIGRLLSLDVQGEELHLHLTDKEKITAYSLAEALSEGTETSSRLVRNEAALTLRYRSRGEDETKGNDHKLLLFLKVVNDSPEAVYYRATFLMPDCTKREYFGVEDTEGKIQPVSGSFLLARDKKDENKYRAEFLYFWGELKDKPEDLNEKRLSDEEKILLRTKSPEEGYLLFRTMRLMRQRRFTEAIDYLEKLWQFACDPDLLTEKDYSDRLDYICYLKGTCHLKTRQYKEAFFYLRMIAHKGVIKYYRLYINCMIASGHPLALAEVKSAEQQTREKIEELNSLEVAIPEEIESFHRFLRRRLIFLHVELHHLQEAEEACLRLMKEQKDTDFALQLLSRIEFLKNNKQ